MKQKAKVYKGKRIVMGDKNLVTKNEIHVDKLSDGNGGSKGFNNVEYLDYYLIHDEFDKYKKQVLAQCAISCCHEYGIYPSYDLFVNMTDGSRPEYIAIDFTLLCFNYEAKKTVLDYLIDNGWTKEELDSIPRISAEEFFSYPKEDA